MAFVSEAKVAYYNCDEHSNMKMSAALRNMQQAGGDHLDHIGLGYEKLYNENMVFLLSKTIAKVHKMPVAGEEINITTTPGFHKGARFTREAIISDRDFTPQVSILTLWVLVDPESRKIMRPSAFPYELPISESILSDNVKDKKLSRLSGIQPYVESKIDVNYSIIDNNKHVNNSSYVDLVCDLLPYEQLIEKGIDEIMIAYQNEAKHGNTVDIKGYKLSDTQYNFEGTKEDGACFEAQIILNK